MGVDHETEPRHELTEEEHAAQIDLYDDCFRRGLTRNDFVVCGIDEGVFDPDEEIEISSDV